MPFENWIKFRLQVKPNNIEEVVVDGTGIIAEIDTAGRAQGATGTGYDNQRVVSVAEARENVEQADWRDDTDDEPDDQELEAHYLYMAKIQEVTPDAADNSRPIFDTEIKPESVNDTYLEEEGDTNITIDSLDISTNGEMVD
ncbi:hypothetical protein Tco_0752253 [Tanacetum coccineum]|uniref:Uncharacterized protein n=1 Tax=Tanacetum coccineum TaxID=301880 RepID=A0ABQ4Z781_9ASTR